jgi:uncharacterized protein YbbC (DUF1343 family)
METVVRSGLDLLVQENMHRLRGKRVALLGNPISVDRDLVHLLDRCIEFDVKLVRLFGPEHGLLGDAQDMDHVNSHVDSKTGLQCISLYGADKESLFLKPEDLDGVDILLCDLQDIGSRYYTFSYSIAFAMRACAASQVKCIVLDRPNPIGGLHVEGNRVKEDYKSFVGEYPLHNRHGYTLGELCTYFQEVHRASGQACDLEIVWMEGWKRNMLFSETNLPWVMPSPNMPTLDTALVYPGICLFEGTNMSEGRGTTRPFELLGAPFIQDPDRLAEHAAQFSGPGVQFRPCFFQPTFQKHAGQICGGVQIHVTDQKQFNAVQTGVALLHGAFTHPGFGWRTEPYEFVSDRLAMDLLFGDDEPRRAMERGASVDEIMGILDKGRESSLSDWERHLHEPYSSENSHLKHING